MSTFHLKYGLQPGMEKGDIVGHEFMGMYSLIISFNAMLMFTMSVAATLSAFPSEKQFRPHD